MATTHAPYIDGHLQNYIYDKYPAEFYQGYSIDNRIKGEWRENKPFARTLQYQGWTRGRSSVNVIWQDDDGKTYPMFMKDFDAILAGGYINMPAIIGPSVVYGDWIVVKRGANYGIQLVLN